MRLSKEIGDCQIGALRKAFRGGNLEKQDTKCLEECNY